MLKLNKVIIKGAALKTNLCMVILAMSAFFVQAKTTNETLKFLGIPIDGTKEQFEAKLLAKDFTHNRYKGGYTGQFNGKNVTVYPVTNHGLVYRVYVEFPSTTSRFKIIEEYNNLLGQLNKNSKYQSFNLDEEIPSDEDILHEMRTYNKRYQASFNYFKPSRDTIEIFKAAVENLQGVVTNDELERWRKNVTKVSSMTQEEQQIMVEQALSQLDNMTSVLGENDSVKALKILSALIEGYTLQADGQVWFMIFENDGKYNIGLYYDNLHNAPHGEDL